MTLCLEGVDEIASFPNGDIHLFKQGNFTINSEYDSEFTEADFSGYGYFGGGTTDSTASDGFPEKIYQPGIFIHDGGTVSNVIAGWRSGGSNSTVEVGGDMSQDMSNADDIITIRLRVKFGS